MLTGRLGLDKARIPHSDRHGLVWLDRGRLEVESGCLRFVTAGGGDLAAGDYQIPHQGVSMILLGPGSSVTHDALRLLARHGCGLAAIGEGAVRFYTAPPLMPDSAAAARAQVTLWADPATRMEVARAMYAIRFGEIVRSRDIDGLRGREGARIKESSPAQAGIDSIGGGLAHARNHRPDLARRRLEEAVRQPSGALPEIVGAKQDVGRDAPLPVQRPGLIHRQRTAPVQDLRSAWAGAEQPAEVGLRIAGRIHPSLDRCDGIGRIDGPARILIGADQRPQNLQAVMIRRTGLGIPKPLDFVDRRFVIRIRANRLHLVHSTPLVRGFTVI